MMQVQNIELYFSERKILSDVSFELEDSGLTALLGCNGAGKTTIMRCILGLEDRYRGKITVNGKNIRGYSPQQRASLIAYIPQINYPSFNYTVLDMVLMGTTHQLNPFRVPGKKQIDEAVKALEQLGIGQLSERSFTLLSGGEKQLVLIARALAQSAHILLMDEPCSALDFGNQNRVMETVRRLANKDYSVLMTTHNPQHVLSYCQRVIALHQGKVLCDGHPDDVMNESVMQKLYSQPVAFVQTQYGRVVMPLHS